MQHPSLWALFLPFAAPCVEIRLSSLESVHDVKICYGIELNPANVDVAVERWQQFTGAKAILAETGEAFADLKAKRLET